MAYEGTESEEPGDFKIKPVDPPKPVEGEVLAIAKSIELVLKDHEGPERPYNVLVVPADDDQHFIYLLPAPTDAVTWVLGGDVRYLVSAEGDKILETRELHDELVEKPAPKEADVKPDQTSEHETKIDNIPEDTDVYYVLTREASMPERVKTPLYKFEIDLDGEITLLDAGKDKAKNSKQTEAKDATKPTSPTQEAKTPKPEDKAKPKPKNDQKGAGSAVPF